MGRPKSGRLRPSLIALLAVWALAPGSLPSAMARACDTNARISVDLVLHQAPPFVVAYSAENGKDTRPPNYVLDALTQLSTMRTLLLTLGFHDPLTIQRYRSQGVNRILVVFREMGDTNGRAFDEPRKLPSGDCALTIHIRPKLPETNPTPAHEYFHLVQYGYTMFKRAWFLEGTARWADNLLAMRRIVSAGHMPATDEARTKLFSSSYSAVQFWEYMIEHCEQPSESDIPDALNELRYSTGRAVIRSPGIRGAQYMRRLLEALSNESYVTSQAMGIDPYLWPEALQRSTHFDEQIWNAAQGACRSD